MKVEEFLERIPSNFFTGVPDSQLKALCDSLMERYGISDKKGAYRIYAKQRAGKCHESSGFSLR